MSADKYEQEYHLTFDGWVEGTFYLYGVAKKLIKPPSNCIRTVVKEVEQSCGFSAEEVSWRTSWQSKEIEIAKLNRILKKYGEHPPLKRL